jgi:predicted  nucleic acid-binding Zn-ribbon protein
MNMISTPPPGDPVWADIRLRYETTTERVNMIAAEVGLSGIRLSMHALKSGWKMRGLPKLVKAKLKRKASVKHETTRNTLLRLKDMLQTRVGQLEDELKEISAEVGSLANERQIRSVNTLVRTLEKVLDLERKDKLKRRKAAEAFRHFTDTERGALADKLERLRADWQGEEAVTNPADERSGGTEPPVALLGEAGPTTATTSN